MNVFPLLFHNDLSHRFTALLDGKHRLVAMLLAGVLLAASGNLKADEPKQIELGVAKIDVTPTIPVVLAGYGSRSKPYESIDTRLWARAMVIGKQKPVAVVVLDNCGIPIEIADRVKANLRKIGLEKDRILVAATHTHNAPNLVGYAPILWQGRMTEDQEQKTEDYTNKVVGQMVKAVETAMKSRQPMTIEWGQGRVTFGGNRRVLRENKWAGFGFQRNAPVDHSLPFLAARDAEGTVRALWANYACHCTTVGSRNSIGGDWAGYANDAIENQFPRAISLLTIGFGADIGPQPSGSLELAKQHGESIANEVVRILNPVPPKPDAVDAEPSVPRMTPLKSEPTVVSRTIPLPLKKPAPREYWEEQLKTRSWSMQLASRLLKQIDEKGSISETVDYPITLWKFGDQLVMAFLPGEVVVDYSVRLKTELDWERLWLTGWANDMPGYIPSRRILMEGGYEAEFSQVYYGLPGPYQPSIENRIVNTLKELAGKDFLADQTQPKSPFHRIPDQEPKAFKELAKWLKTPKTGNETIILEKIRSILPRVRPAVDSISKSFGERTEWFNFAGDQVPRVFIRQEKPGPQIAWTVPGEPVAKQSAQPEKPEDKKGRVRKTALPTILGFSGGLGWESEPRTEGFELVITENETIGFDVTRKLSHWKSKSGRSELIYLPTWRSDVDSGGFFFLILNDPVQQKGKGELVIRSIGSGSKRWFGLDAQQRMIKHREKLIDAFSANK